MDSEGVYQLTEANAAKGHYAQFTACESMMLRAEKWQTKGNSGLLYVAQLSLWWFRIQNQQK